MKNMTLEVIAKACNGAIYNMNSDVADREAACIVVDSRQVEEDFIFVATKGERVDGHKFIPDVFAKGALGVICEVLPEDPAGPCILVEDSFNALKAVAAYYRQQLDITVVGITGSVGKTSTKEFIAAVLARHYNVHKTAGNFNNEVGLPLTIAKITPEHEIAVLEMGINSFGEMHRLTEVAKPDICVMTNIGECHLENLIDRDGVLRAKSEIFDCMNPEGTVVVNGDDDKLATIKEVYGKAPIAFGFSDGLDVWADQVENLGLFGSKAVLHLGDMEIHAEIALPGKHMIGNAMAAAAVGRALGLTKEEIEAGIKDVQPVAGRSHLIKTADQVIIDDCYNANPVSMKAAIDLLKTAGTRTVAILGDMYELGADEKAMHAGVGTYAAKAGIDEIVCVGEISKSMYDATIAAGGHTHYFETKDALFAGLPKILKPGDTILVKASNGMGFKAVVEFLTK